MFTIYYLEENIEFGNSENYKKRPTVTNDIFHSQFKIKLGTYRDNNNFLKINNVQTNDERYMVFRNSR